MTVQFLASVADSVRLVKGTWIGVPSPVGWSFMSFFYRLAHYKQHGRNPGGNYRNGRRVASSCGLVTGIFLKQPAWRN